MVKCKNLQENFRDLDDLQGEAEGLTVQRLLGLEQMTEEKPPETVLDR